MKYRWLVIFFFAFLVFITFGGEALAQGEPPPPYAGLENPFSWDDQKAQETGKSVYEQKCGACHGQDGSIISDSNFSVPEYSELIMSEPDYVFWMISEGRLINGMPPYKSSLSEEQLWQVITYMYTIGITEDKTLPGKTPESTPVEHQTLENVSLTVIAPKQAATGQLILLTAHVKDQNLQPISDENVLFYLTEEFFIQDEMYIGEAVTDEQGVAVLTYIPTGDGETTVVAKYGTSEGKMTLTIADSGVVFYQPEAKTSKSSNSKDIFIGPDSARELDKHGNAPSSALYLPGGLFSWLWLYIGILAVVWGTYWLVMHQILGISRLDTSGSRAIPTIALVIVSVMGLIALLMVLTSPYSHFHLQ
ncbi:c-type cytochrome [Chloroflexota bacterium]